MWHVLNVIRVIGTWIIALIILFEEWGWEPLARLMGKLARLPLIQSMEQRIQRLPPHPALAIFLLPGAFLFPIKLLALKLIATGHPIGGLIVIGLAKVIGTAIAARLFTLTKPTLVQLPWFAALYGRWITWKEALLTRVRASAVWRSAHAIKHYAKQRVDTIRRLFSHDS